MNGSLVAYNLDDLFPCSVKPVVGPGVCNGQDMGSGVEMFRNFEIHFLIQDGNFVNFTGFASGEYQQDKDRKINFQHLIQVFCIL